jgi:LacI family transcriptional regulator
VDGVLLLWPSQTSDQTDQLAQSSIPVVVIAASANSTSALTSSVDVENVLGGRLAAQHLIDLGHQNAVYVAGALDQESVNQRYRGFCDVFADHNLPRPRIIGFSFNPAVIEPATNAHLCADKSATAYFTTNDSLTLSVIRVAAKHGLSTPADISVVGFDDAPFAQHMSPLLTIFVVSMETIAETAMRQLIGLVAGETAEEVRIPPRLIRRESTGQLVNWSTGQLVNWSTGQLVNWRTYRNGNRKA